MKKQKDDITNDDEQTISNMLKDGINKIKTYIQRDDFVSDVSFEIGKSFRAAKDTCVEIFNDLMDY